MAEAVQKENLTVAAVLSGNRNFEGRINPLVRANYLASPPLVVAYALAGRMDIDLDSEPLGEDSNGQASLSAATSGRPTKKCADRGAAFRPQRDVPERIRGSLSRATPTGTRMPVPAGDLYEWDR